MQFPLAVAIPAAIILPAAGTAAVALRAAVRARTRLRDLENEHLPPCEYPPGCNNGPDPHPRREGCAEFGEPPPEPAPGPEGPCGCGGACAAEIAAVLPPSGHRVDCFTPGCDSSCLETQPEPEPEGGTT